MEYPMATLITGHRSLVSLVGVTLHEYLHSWYHTVLGFNESLYYWMDEGFVSYAETRVMNHLISTGFLPGTVSAFPYDNDFKAYYLIHTRGIEEPLSTHADHFVYNTAYSFAAYTKGSIFLHQLEYIMGTNPFRNALLEFYDRWKFRHPDANDLIRVMEELSGMELDWYKEYMVYTTKTIDYAVDTLMAEDEATWLSLVKYGSMPMPVDFKIQMTNGETQLFTIPLNLMRKAKQDVSANGLPFSILPSWDWVNPYYDIKLAIPRDEIESITLDPYHRMADMDRNNNDWPPIVIESE
jgi:aminopeptidase N